MGSISDDERPSDDPYYIQASSLAADRPKLVLKHNDAFLVADTRGDCPDLPESEFGFYVDGTRFLGRLELVMHGQPPLVLNAALSEDTLQIAVDLTNPDIFQGDAIALPGRMLRIARLLTIVDNQLYQQLRIESFADVSHALTLAWRFGADFVDLFEVRGFSRAGRGTLAMPGHDADHVTLGYDGLDGVRRTTHLAFSPAPSRLTGAAATYEMTLAPRAVAEISVVATGTTGAPATPQNLGFGAVMNRRRGASAELRSAAAVVASDHQQFNVWMDRARTDLHMLLTETPEGFIPYAGIPWFVAPFGRDSLITALQMLPFEPSVARGTLRYLARHQATVEDEFTDQQPGKILHELRRGELANLREIPFIPYYGTVDATPLFVVLLAGYVRWTGDRDLARELWPAVRAALTWMQGPGSPDGDGYLKYVQRSSTGLLNQGWKDSRDAIMHASGELARAPIALAEVQGYHYAALVGAADLSDAIGGGEQASDLRDAAVRLRARFEHDFWLEDEGFYALALDGDGRPCRVISSNPGHCLWTGIVDPERAPSVAKHLLGDAMFTGWGVRTLSARERLYNPMSYHNGSVWPHDTAITAAGLRRYGLADAFLALSTGLFQAVLHWDGLRMPELFCGFPRQPGYGPTRYPVACSPQAWAAGVVFELVSGMLGFMPDARRNQLTLDRPILPTWLNWVEVRNLQFRGSRLSFIVERGRQGSAVELLGREGDAEVLIRR
jgi:glycogen debranching enzyme